MRLTDILNALAENEKGAEMKTYLQGLLSAKDNDLATAENKATQAEAQLKTVATILGTTVEELAGKAKETLSQAAESEANKTKLAETQTKNETLTKEKGELERKDRLTTFANTAKADREVLIDLLPADAAFGTDKDGAFITVDNKRVAFDEYVENDARLIKYKASIFNTASETTQQAASAQTNFKAPSGKGKDDNKITTDAQAVAKRHADAYQTPIKDRIKARLQGK